MKRIIGFTLVMCMLLSMVNISFAATTTPVATDFAPSFSGGTLGGVPKGWSGVNMCYGNGAGGYYGQISNYKPGQGWGANGYLVYDNYIWSGDLSYSVAVNGYDSTNSETDHRTKIMFNYKDSENYYFVDFGANVASNVYLKKKVANVDTTIATATAAGVTIKPEIVLSVSYKSADKTISVKAGTIDVFTNVNDTTFSGGKIGFAAQASSYINFRNVVVSGMAIDKTPVDTGGGVIITEPDSATFTPVLPNSGSVPAGWTGSGIILGTWGNFTHATWGGNGSLVYDNYLWQDNLTYTLKISNYDNTTMSFYMYFLYKDANNYYAVVFNSATKAVDLVKKVAGTETVIQSYPWGVSIADHFATVVYNNGKISASATKGTESWTFFTDVADSSLTAGKIGIGFNKGGFHAATISVNGIARQVREAGDFLFPARENVNRKLPTITSAVDVPVPDVLKERVKKTYPDGLVKAVIMDFDDGTQGWMDYGGYDTKVINILNKYNMRGTFNLSASNSTSGYTDAQDTKYAAMYKGHEIATHQVNHNEPRDLDIATLTYELQTSKTWFEKMTAKWGTIPTVDTAGLAIAQVGGWAYPGGGKDITTEQMAVAESLGIKYGRRSVVNPATNYQVKIPTSFFNWQATCSFAGNVAASQSLQTRYLASDLDYMTVFYSWSHAWDICTSPANTVDKTAAFDTFCKEFARNSATIWNPGVLEFVDYVNASRNLTVTGDATTFSITNPSNAIDVWAVVDYENVMIPAGQTLNFGQTAGSINISGFTATEAVGGDKLSFTVNATNTTSNAADVFVVVALYKQQGSTPIMVNSACKSVTGLASNASDALTGEFSLTGLSDYTIKAFIWNSKTGLQPYDIKSKAKADIALGTSSFVDNIYVGNKN